MIFMALFLGFSWVFVRALFIFSGFFAWFGGYELKGFVSSSGFLLVF